MIDRSYELRDTDDQIKKDARLVAFIKNKRDEKNKKLKSKES